MRNRLKWMGWALASAALLALAGCTTLAGVLQTPTPPPTQIPTLAYVTVTPGVTPTPTMPSVCAFVLASKDAPDAAALLSQAYRTAGFANVDVRAAASGENCIDTDTNRIAAFTAMQTDFYLTLAVQDTTDTQALGDWIARLVPVINQVPAGQLPGPNPGDIGVQFKSGTAEANLWFPRQTAQQLIQKGVSGSALYEALSATNGQ